VAGDLGDLGQELDDAGPVPRQPHAGRQGGIVVPAGECHEGPAKPVPAGISGRAGRPSWPRAQTTILLQRAAIVKVRFQTARCSSKLGRRDAAAETQCGKAALGD